jgi:hypothetical protein
MLNAHLHTEETMQAPWHEGDTSSGTCNVCRKPVMTRFENRTIRPTRSRVSYSDVLVSVCTECNELVDMPRQSLAQLRELASWK